VTGGVPRSARSSILEGRSLGPEAIREASVVFKSVCEEFGLRDKDDPATRSDRGKLRSVTRKEFNLEH
jgi:hypothetical protein